MPVLVDFKVKCDKCGTFVIVEIPVSSVTGREPRFDTSMVDLQTQVGWEIKDVSSYRTKVLCPTCK